MARGAVQAAPRPAAVRADGRRSVVVTGGSDGTLRSWDVGSGKAVERRDCLGSDDAPAAVTSMAVLGGGLWAAGTAMGGLELHDGRAGPRAVVARCEAAHSDAVLGVAPGGGEGISVTASVDGLCRRWDLRIATAPTHSWGTADGPMLLACGAGAAGRVAVGSGDGVVTLLDDATLEQRGQIKGSPPSPGRGSARLWLRLGLLLTLWYAGPTDAPIVALSATTWGIAVADADGGARLVPIPIDDRS